MTRMSKTKLVEFLIGHGFIVNGNAIGFEAYGKKVMAYIKVEDMAARKELESLLQNAGQKPNTNYFPGAPYVEVPVSYFKALHWDE